MSLKESYGYPGGPYDRGKADSYYGRSCEPHYWPDGFQNGKCVKEENMSRAEVLAYFVGWDDNEAAGNFKDWR